MKRLHLFVASTLVLVAAGLVWFWTVHRRGGSASGGRAVAGLSAGAEDVARTRLRQAFRTRGIGYPPARAVLLGIKMEGVLEVYASGPGGGLRFVGYHPVLSSTGGVGPKLRADDLQVPEGVYRIAGLGAGSDAPVLRLDYPNAFDREQAMRDGRAGLGGEVTICAAGGQPGALAVGDRALEELTVLAADAGVSNVTVILAPVDFRKGFRIPSGVTLPAWAPMLYVAIKTRMAELPVTR